jgi:signal transduction histidine kinase
VSIPRDSAIAATPGAPSGGDGPQADERQRRVAELEQRALALEDEIGRRERLEVERARLLDAERMARAEVALLYRLTDAANRAETLEQLYAAALDGISTALGVERASILLFDSDGVMRFKAWRGLSDAYRATVEGHSPWRAEDRNPPPALVPDVRQDPALGPLRPAFDAEGIGALGFFPLWSGERLLGKFMVYYRGAHAFTDAETRLAAAIADQIALAVDRQLAVLERERVLGVVGHDLRNPLNAITVSAATLLRRELDDEVARSVRRIQTSARRMERLITQLLEFAQARHGGGIPVHARATDLVAVTRTVLDELAAANDGRSLLLHAEADVTGEWDPDLLGEALSNVVGNAVQHGTGDVHVHLHADGEEVVLEIHNDGPPIPGDVLPQLFDPFRRGTAPEAERSRSVGLGLFITREIVRAHRGAIEVRSTEAEGTTAVVRLPRGARG